MISFQHSGSLKNTEDFLRKVSRINVGSILETYAKEGVSALAAATPVDSRLASASWGYKITKAGSGWTITWTNSDIENGFPVAIMLQYGHGTKTGGYVAGRNYINPAIRPIFDKIADKVRKEVTSA